MNNDFLSLMELFNEVNSEFSFDMICKMDAEQKQEYERLLNLFLEYNSKQNDENYSPNELNRLKGKTLEELVAYLLRVSGNLFEIKQNLRTTTNEID